MSYGRDFHRPAADQRRDGSNLPRQSANDPRQPGRGRFGAIERVCASAGIKPSALTELMHGTTATTNAVLEGKGARVELVTTEGYRQILQVARSYVPGGLAGWIVWPKPEPLAALDDTVEVRERIGARGEVMRGLDEASARGAQEAQATRGRGRDRIADKCLREPRARTAHPRDRQRGSA
jgi:N-methylhydantoinase A